MIKLFHMSLSNVSVVAFHYRSYGTFCIYSKRLYNLYSGFTHYRNYRALTFGVWLTYSILFCMQKQPPFPMIVRFSYSTLVYVAAFSRKVSNSPLAFTSAITLSIAVFSSVLPFGKAMTFEFSSIVGNSTDAMAKSEFCET